MKLKVKMKNEIILYRPNELNEHIEVKIDENTVWLSKEQISILFGRDRTVISRHISNIFKEGELQKDQVCAYFAHTTKHGALRDKTQTVRVEHFNLDVIISVGYRVKSNQGTQFRIWANKVLKDYLLRGYALNQRMNRIENTVENLADKVNEIDLQIKTQLIPTQGIFFEGQIFDAWNFVSDLVRKAEKSLILIDNFIDDSVLMLFAKRTKNVNVTLYTKSISKQLELDLKKFNTQYAPISIKQFSKAHDRFLIIDEKEVYLIGASLKDLGKKWFGFSRIDSFLEIIMKNLVK